MNYNINTAKHQGQRSPLLLKYPSGNLQEITNAQKYYQDLDREQIASQSSNAHKEALSFSYSLNADFFQSTFEQTINSHISSMKDDYQNHYLSRENDLRKFLNSIVLRDLKTNRISMMNYEETKQGKVRDDINYKNSFIQFAYDDIENATPIFQTVTVGSSHHPFKYFDKNFVLNNNFLNDFEKDSFESKQEMKDYFDKKVFESYKLLNEFERNFYKQKLFRAGALTSDNRARILAYEPHKNSLVAHLHKLEVINNSHLFEYIRTFKNQHLKYALGRSEISIFERSFDEIKTRLKLKKINKTDYKIVDSEHRENEYIYIRVLKDRSKNEVRSISNYLTNYLETNTVLLDSSTKDNREKNKKKSSIAYHGWAYYVADLKDKFIPKDDGNYRKIRRIRYSRKLLSKQVYRDIFNQEFKAELEKNGDYQKHNMYAKMTQLLKDETLKIYRIYRKEFNYDIDELEVMNDKVMYYKLEYRDRELLIDNVKTMAYRYTERDIFKKLEDLEKLKVLTQINQIDLETDDWVFDRYYYDNDKEELFDIDFIRSECAY